MNEWIIGLIAAGMAMGLVVAFAAVVDFVIIRIFSEPG
jgi:hypothetical protein